MATESEVREAVQAKSGLLSDQAWDWLVALWTKNEEPSWETVSASAATSEIVDEYRIARRFLMPPRPAKPATPPERRIRTKRADGCSEGSDYPRPPAWWTQQAMALMEQARPAQQLAWSLLGLSAPVVLADVERVILEQAGGEEQTGTRNILAYPDPASLPGLIIGRETVVYAGSDEAGGDRDSQALAVVAGLVRSLAERTGCRDEEVTAFLLCDLGLRLPWVDYDYVLPGPPASIAPAITLTIGTPEVPIEDVVRAYRFARDFLRSRESRAGEPRRRRSRPATDEIVPFVEQRLSDQSWDEIFVAWSKTHPAGSKGFHKSIPAMRRAYYRAPLRRRRKS